MKIKALPLRYGIIVGFIFLVCAGIVVKMMRTIFVDGDEWRAKSDKILLDTSDVLALRGDILAADGRQLSMSVPLYTVFIDFKAGGFDSLLFVQPARFDSLCHSLAMLQGNRHTERTAEWHKKHLKKGLAQGSRYYRLTYARLSYDERRALPTFAYFNSPKKANCLVFNELQGRSRPFGNLAAVTVGGVLSDVINGKNHAGSAGIEKACDSLLRGVDGLEVRRRAQRRWVSDVLKQPEQGMDIHTTIDIDIQDMLETTLSDKLEETQAAYGTAVIMEVETGAIRAMANLERAANGTYVEPEYTNHAISDFTEPGSTFKTASMMVALDAGVVRPDDIVDTGKGLFRYAGQNMKDHNYSKGGYGEITAAQSIWYSSNIGISKIILKGFENEPHKFVDGLYAIGLDKPVTLGLPGEIAPRIKYPVDSVGRRNPQWSKISLPWMSFGYEVSIPPLYTLIFYNAIANGGKMISPYLISGISRNGDMEETFGSEVMNEQICKPQTLKEIQQMLADVVRHGTASGRKAVTSNYVQIAGKTGTAQIHQGEQGYKGGAVRHRVSFCGYFPAENPKYTGIVVISAPTVGYASGGTMPGAVLRSVADQMYARGYIPGVNELPHDTVRVKMPVVKTGNHADTKRVCDALSLPVSPVGNVGWVDTKAQNHVIELSEIAPNSITVPSVRGMGARDAIYLLERVGLAVDVSGRGRVVSQSLPVGRRVRSGDKITIVLK